MNDCRIGTCKNHGGCGYQSRGVGIALEGLAKLKGTISKTKSSLKGRMDEMRGERTASIITTDFRVCLFFLRGDKTFSQAAGS